MASYNLPNLRVPVPPIFNTVDYTQGTSGAGVVGPAGPSGPQGLSGSQGILGFQGHTGEGSQGVQGNTQDFINNVFLGLDSGSGYATEGNQYAIAIGNQAGYLNQGNNTIAIGRYSQSQSSEEGAIAIGTGAGRIYQGAYSTSLGFESGFQAGIYSLNLGAYAGGGIGTQGAHSIVLNATGNFLDAGGTGLYISPLNIGDSDYILGYNNQSKEVQYQVSGVQPSDYNALSYTSIGTFPSIPKTYFTTSVYASTATTNIQFAMTPNAQRILLVDGYNKASTIYQSTDYGENFSTITTSPYYLGALCVSLSGQNQYVLVRNDSNYIFYILCSYDFGATFSSTSIPALSNSSGPVLIAGISCSSDGRIVIISSDISILVSYDYGQSFSRDLGTELSLGGSMYNYATAINPSGKYWVVVAFDSVFVSSNGGTSFTTVQPVGLSDASVGNVSISESGKYIIFTDPTNNSVWISLDYGQTFTSVALGNAYGTTSMTASGSLMIVIPDLSVSGVIPFKYSIDYGATWVSSDTTNEELRGVARFGRISYNGQYIALNSYLSSDFPFRITSCTADDFMTNLATYSNADISASSGTLFNFDIPVPALYDVFRIKGVGFFDVNQVGMGAGLMQLFFYDTITSTIILQSESSYWTEQASGTCPFTIELEIFIAELDMDADTSTQIISGKVIYGEVPNSGDAWGVNGTKASFFGTAVRTTTSGNSILEVRNFAVDFACTNSGTTSRLYYYTLETLKGRSAT